MVCLQLRLRAANCRDASWCLPLFGFQTGRALISGSVLMLVLTFGSALRQDWPTVGIQLTYSLIYSLLPAGKRFNSYSVDSRLHRSP